MFLVKSLLASAKLTHIASLWFAEIRWYGNALNEAELTCQRLYVLEYGSTIGFIRKWTLKRWFLNFLYTSKKDWHIARCNRVYFHFFGQWLAARFPLKCNTTPRSYVGELPRLFLLTWSFTWRAECMGPACWSNHIVQYRQRTFTLPVPWQYEHTIRAVPTAPAPIHPWQEIHTPLMYSWPIPLQVLHVVSTSLRPLPLQASHCSLRKPVALQKVQGAILLY